MSGKSIASVMILTFCTTQLLLGQSLFNRFTGADFLTGSGKSAALGNTHLLNSTGSSIGRFNPAALASSPSTIDLQHTRLNVFERRSMPVRDSFDEFLTHADYVANTFNTNYFQAGITYNQVILGVGAMGVGVSLSPLTHFNYSYTEEVRGSYRTEDGEYAGKDPVVGFQKLETEGMLRIVTFATGLNLQELLQLNGNVGFSINRILESELTETVQVDSLYADVTNLSTYPDVIQSAQTPSENFVSVSTTIPLFSFIDFAAGFESAVTIQSDSFHWERDTTNGFYQFWNDSSKYAVSGVNFIKPAKTTLGISYAGGQDKNISLHFETEFLQFDNHQGLNDTKNLKFGFEYKTQKGTPIRGGLIYAGSPLSGINPVSVFTFGTGKTIHNLQIDVGGNYGIQSFNHPDLFPVSNDIRPDYDLVRESQFQLHFSIRYLW